VQQIYIASYFGNGYSRFMKYRTDISNHPKRAVIEHRIKVIDFFDTFGIEATRQAFGKSRATVYLWKKKLKQGEGKLSSLAPKDTTPLHKRHRVVDPFITAFIVNYRLQHPGVDKVTIAPILASACHTQGITPISESTVGRIIRDLKEQRKLPRSNKLSLSGKTGRLIERLPHRKQRKLRRKEYIPHYPGDLVQMDTVAMFAAGVKRYLFTAIDVRTRFAFACAYQSNSSTNGSDFLEKFLQVAPFVTRRIQTDNGSEFLKHFAQRCERKRVTHFFNYPKHPQANGCLERFNRTIQEQFVYANIHYIDETLAFNRHLMDYLIWYNTERAHRSIGKIPPLRYYVDNFLPHAKSNIYWTLTSP